MKPKKIKFFLWFVYFSYHFEGLIEQSFSFLKLNKRDLGLFKRITIILLFCYIIVIAAKNSKSNQASLNIAGINCLIEFQSILKPKGSFLVVFR